MRIDARAGDTGWCVFHVPQAGVLKYVIWVDDETAMWCEFAHPLRLDRATGSAATITHQAKAIRIIPADRLVLIDPVDDSEDITEPAQKDLVVS
jgi:hypothetical protein